MPEEPRSSLTDYESEVSLCARTNDEPKRDHPGSGRYGHIKYC